MVIMLLDPFNSVHAKEETCDIWVLKVPGGFLLNGEFCTVLSLPKVPLIIDGIFMACSTVSKVACMPRLLK